MCSRAVVGGRGVGSQAEGSGPVHLSADREEVQSQGLMGRGRWKGMLLTKLKYGLSALFSLFCTLSHVLGSSGPLPPRESRSSPLCCPWLSLGPCSPCWSPFLRSWFCYSSSFLGLCCLLHPTLFPSFFWFWFLLSGSPPSPLPQLSLSWGCRLSFFPGKPAVNDFTSASWSSPGWAPAPLAG